MQQLLMLAIRVQICLIYKSNLDSLMYNPMPEYNSGMGCAKSLYFRAKNKNLPESERKFVKDRNSCER